MYRKPFLQLFNHLLGENCGICQHKSKSKPREPILERPIPKLTFEQVATDLFNFIEYDRLQNSASSKEVIEKLKKWFSVHGQPQQVYSDNEPQYLSMEFKGFTQEWNFEHVTSSPKYPQSNGQAERAVLIVNGILKKCKIDCSDTGLAMLAQRNTSRDHQHKD
jgi:hypothetical protein